VCGGKLDAGGRTCPEVEYVLRWCVEGSLHVPQWLSF
jgi:hypothetical protein